MLESLTVATGLVNQPTVPPANFAGFLTNSDCGSAGSCPAPNCISVTTALPIFSEGNPSAPPAPQGRFIQACYFNHPRLTWDLLDRNPAPPAQGFDQSARTQWISTGCARPCVGANCAELTSSESSSPPTTAPTPQRCVGWHYALLCTRCFSPLICAYQSLCFPDFSPPTAFKPLFCF